MVKPSALLYLSNGWSIQLIAMFFSNLDGQINTQLYLSFLCGQKDAFNLKPKRSRMKAFHGFIPALPQAHCSRACSLYYCCVAMVESVFWVPVYTWITSNAGAMTHGINFELIPIVSCKCRHSMPMLLQKYLPTLSHEYHGDFIRTLGQYSMLKKWKMSIIVIVTFVK